MTTTPTTRFARVLGCMAFSLALAVVAPLAGAQSNGTELLINGGFEDGLTSSMTKANGWTTGLNANFYVLATKINPKPVDTNTMVVSPAYVDSGNYSLRRTIYQGQGAGTTASFFSDRYEFSALTETVSAGDTLRLSLDGLGSGVAGEFEIYGKIIFYSGATEISSFLTSTVSGSGNTWKSMEASIIVPENATAFVVAGVADFKQAVGGIRYVAFDNFSLTLVPEPATVSAVIALVIGAAVVSYRRKQRKA